MKVLFYVQHLLGIGHVRRAAAITRALTDAGAEVTIAQGGFPVPGIDFAPARVVPLAPVRSADAAFSGLVDAGGVRVGDAWRHSRKEDLLRLYATQPWDVLLVETFPFGRRQFRFELGPLLDAARASQDRPLAAASVRDILVRKADPAKPRAMADDALRWFDLVFVHGDPAVVPFGASFPEATRIDELIRYTGYVASPPLADDGGSDGRGEVIVSVGGGAVGESLLRAALAARPFCRLAESPWRLLAGRDLPAPVFEDLRATAPDGVTVEWARADFPLLLRRCRLSISQAGYNTVMDLLSAGCPAVLVPFAAGKETEQRDRADILEARGLAVCVDSAGLDANAFASALAAGADRAIGDAAAGSRPSAPIRADGAAETARMLIAAAARTAGSRGGVR